MPTSVTNSGFSTSAYDAANTAGRVAQKTLGQDDFLKLITVQLAKQDPMKPMEDTAFIAQMANFSALEAQNALAKEMGYLRADSQLQAASGLIGREVTLANRDRSITGVVDGVSTDERGTYVQVGGVDYAFSTITAVRPAPPPPTPAAA